MQQTTVNKLRLFLFMVGIALVIVSLSADVTGLSAQGLSQGQILVAIAGAILAIVGAFGGKFVDFYKGTALLLLNTMVFIILIEIGFGVISKLISLDSSDNSEQPYEQFLDLSYYQERDWSDAYRAEDWVVRNLYFKPYVEWKARPFNGSQIKIDEQGNRVTPDANCTEDAYTVFVFGGSTLFGTGAPDWGTIPAYLQQNLAIERSEPVCVVNMGQLAYVANQSLVALQLELQKGNIPDLVIFYQGINDTYGAYLYGSADVILGQESVAARFEGTVEQESLRDEFVRLIQDNSYTYRVLHRLVDDPSPKEITSEEAQRITYQKRGVDRDTLVEAVVQHQIQIYGQLERLADVYDFEFYYFWQPMIAVDEKVFTEEEQAIRDYVEPTMVDFYQVVYEQVKDTVSEYDRFYYVGDAVKGIEQFIWIDQFHMVPEGNQIVAQKMMEIINP